MTIRTQVYDASAEPIGPSVAVMSDFETVHAGEVAMLAAAAADASERVLPLVALVLDASGEPGAPAPLLPPEERDRLLEAAGVDVVLTIPLAPTLAEKPAETFVDGVILRAVRPAVLHVARDVRFGLADSGDCETLTRYGVMNDFIVRAHSAVEVNGQPVTARRVREAAESGNPALVEQLLGRAWKPLPAAPRPAPAPAPTGDFVWDGVDTAPEPPEPAAAPEAGSSEQPEEDRDGEPEYVDPLLGGFGDLDHMPDGSPVVSDPDALAAAEAALIGVRGGPRPRYSGGEPLANIASTDDWNLAFLSWAAPGLLERGFAVEWYPLDPDTLADDAPAPNRYALQIPAAQAKDAREAVNELALQWDADPELGVGDPDSGEPDNDIAELPAFGMPGMPSRATLLRNVPFVIGALVLLLIARCTRF